MFVRCLIIIKTNAEDIRVGWVKMTFSLLTEALESWEMFALLEDLVIHAEMLRYLEKGGNKWALVMPIIANLSQMCEKSKINVIDAPYHTYTDTGKKYISDLILKQIIWVIEVSDARIKTWRCFDCSFTSNQILFIRDCVRIVCT